MIEEIWIPIKDWEDRYSVSNMGRIKTVARFVGSGSGEFWREEIILKPLFTEKGYLVVNLNRGNTKITKPSKIHRLVALHFIDNPDNKPTVNHEDGDRTNNKINNLTWATHQEQSDHFKNVLHHKAGRKPKNVLIL
jgi:hypothetical protein